VKRRGSGPKPSRISDKINVTYSPSHWNRFAKLRQQSLKVIGALVSTGYSGIVHGSVARGDVDDKSDVDVLVEGRPNCQLVETALENFGFTICSREIAQATPSHSPKAHLFLDPEQLTSVTVPLIPLRSLESEFYSFGGTVSLQQIEQGLRSLGCTKRLLLIEPTRDGHFESSVQGNESEVADLLGLSVAIVKERVRVLNRRDAIGRTGMYLRIPVHDGESFDQVLRTQSYLDPAVRRTLRKRS